MALVLSDRVLETCTSPGTGAVTLLGAVTGYQAFSSGVGDGNTCYYCIADQGGNNWEVGIGTYATSGNTLTRTTPLSGSSATPVDFSTGVQNVFVTYPAEKSVNYDEAGNVVIAANTTGNALRITQTGSGNALVVEDSANPDSTPVVVNSSGQLLIGGTAAVIESEGESPFCQTNGTDSRWGYAATRFSANNQGTGLYFGKSRGATVGDYTVVQDGDELGRITFSGADGTDMYTQGARIQAQVDGTPGTNDMPGRLVFSTTADGASNPTERMRIDNAGRVGIGTVAPSAVPGATLYLNKSLTGGVVGVGAALGATILSDVTAVGRGFSTEISVQNAAFTLPSLQHYLALQGTKGASATVTAQYGFYADSSLTGATNNYGFYSNIASGTGRYNFYAAGSANNYFAGSVGIANSSPSYPLDVTGNIHTTANYVLDNDNALYWGAGDGSTKIVGNSSTDYLAFTTNSAERMRIDSVGNVGIGGTPSTGQTLDILKSMVGDGSGNGANIRIYNAVQSSATNNASGVQTWISTAASAFTLANLQHYWATQNTIGAGSAVTNQYGFNAASSLTGATNNYGFYSAIAASTGRWNFYAAGSARNLFTGNTGVGSDSGATIKFYVGGNSTGSTNMLGLRVNETALSDVTNSYIGVDSLLSTQAASFAMTSSTSYRAGLGSIGAGSSVGNVSAFQALSNLAVGTSSNVAFYGQFPSSAAGAWNAYMSGTAPNYFAGSVGIGDTNLTTTSFKISKGITGGTSAWATLVNSTVQSDVTVSAEIFRTNPSTAAAAFTVTDFSHYYCTFGTLGAGSAVSNQYGFRVGTITGANATNTFGVYSNIAVGTGRFNINASGSADNYFAGKVGIGATPFSGATLTVASLDTTASTYAVDVALTIPATSTTAYYSYLSYPQTAAASFTLAKLAHYEANAPSLGAGSAVTNQYGFSAQNGVIGATNNYGFYSNIASGTGRWNFYAAGGADNYFSGSVGIGGSGSGSKLRVVTDRALTTYTLQLSTFNGATFENDFVAGFTGSVQNIGNYQNFPLAFVTNNTERARIDTSGNFFVGTTTNTNSSKIISSGTISETVSSTQYLVASQYDVGTAPNQIPLNQYLGTLAFQDSSNVTVDRLYVNSVSSVKALLEAVTVSATAATGTINFDVATQGVLYYTTNASANWTMNVRGSSTATLDSIMQIGQSCTVIFMATNGATPYYASAFQVDGSAVTVKWQQGITPASGNANSIDMYTYSIIKTAAATYTVIGNQIKYA